MSAADPGRISLLSLEEARSRAEDLDMPGAFAELNVFRVLLHQPNAAKAVSDLLLTLLFRSKLDDRLRELVIMRIGWASGCDYEWTQHWRIALERSWCSKTDLLAVRDWRASGHFDPAARAILAATDETLAEGTISEATWKQVESCLGSEVERLELVLAISCWGLISRVARTLGFPLEEGVASWPPDGAGPA